MKITGDFHTHTRASDGRGTAKDNISAAFARGLNDVGITDHGFGSLIAHMTPEKFEAQRAEIKEPVGAIAVYQGIEANLLNWSGDIDLPEETIARCGILSLGFHRFLEPAMIGGNRRFVFVNGFGSASSRRRPEIVRKNTEAFISAMERYPVDVLAHPSHRALIDAAAVFAAAAEIGVYIELNEKHIDALEEVVGDALKCGANFILGSDAHSPDKVGSFPKVSRFIREHGVPTAGICGIDGRIPVIRNKNI